MTGNFRTTAIAALAALLLTLMVLTFVATNPWMLAGVAAVLWAIAAIVRAINGTAAHHDDHEPADQDRHQGDRDQADGATDPSVDDTP